MVRVFATLFVVLIRVIDAAPLLASPTDRLGFPVSVGRLGYGNKPFQLQIVDLDGDGRRELVIPWADSGGGGGVDIRRGDGGLVMTIPEQSDNACLATDLDGDGTLEVVAGAEGIAAYSADGILLWRVPRVQGDPLFQWVYPSGLSIGDLDADGSFSIVMTTPDQYLYVFGLDGALRQGWPLFTPYGVSPINGTFYGTPSFASASLVDIEGDGHLEMLRGGGDLVYCYHSDQSPCAGFPVAHWLEDSYHPRFDLIPLLVWPSPDGSYRISAASRLKRNYLNYPEKLVYVWDRNGQAVSPFPLPYPGPFWTPFSSLLEHQDAHWIVIGGNGTHVVMNLTSGAILPGWPVTSTVTASCPPLVGELDGTPGPDILIAGWGRVDAFRLDGTRIPGFPRTLPSGEEVEGAVLGTFDGIETTFCWGAYRSGGNLAQVTCTDLGVPWNRGNVQYGQYGFDMAHTGRFRRLWQIDRPKTSLSLSATEVSSISGAPVELQLRPRDAANLTLGADQEIRLARTPVLGGFTGPLTYDAAAGVYRRNYTPPVQEEAAEIEFSAWVNEERDDDRVRLRLRGRPRVDLAQPGGIPRGLTITDVSMQGIDFSPVPRVVAATPALRVLSSEVLGKDWVRARVRAEPWAPIGWSGLRIVSEDGRESNSSPLFVYDPAETTLVVTPAAGGSRLEWFGGGSALTNWRLVRSTEPSFASWTTVYLGRNRSATDAALPANGYFYRVIAE